MRCASLVLLVACGASASSVDRAAAVAEDRAPAVPGAPGTPGVLGMNDVSILLPLPSDPRVPVLATIAGDGAALVPRAWFDALVTAQHDIAPRTGGPIAFDDFHVVAIRFDLCERSTVGACPRDADGRLRLVLQPLYTRAGATAAHDVAVHAFYAVAASEIAAVVGELRALARLGGQRSDAPLSVSPAVLVGNAAYLSRLRALVIRHADAARLERLTVIGQVADSAAFAWIFRGLDRAVDRAADHAVDRAVGRGDAGFVPLVIPGIEAEQQTVQLAGGDTVYLARPVVDVPAGFALAINGPRFAAATSEQRAAALEALTAIQNPLVHDAIDTQCVGCHVATYLTIRRAAASGSAPAAIPGRFVSAHDLAVNTIAGSDPRVVRAFGWAASVPAISQRVANDTAEVLAEIEARFPTR